MLWQRRWGRLVGIEIFIIHLARAEARRPHVDYLLTSMPLPASVINAVDGAVLTEGEIRSAYVRRLHRPLYPFALSRNEIACFLSHQRAWQAIVDRNLDAALIMEDDAAPTGDFHAGLQVAIDHVQNCGFIRFPFRDGREIGRRIDCSGRVSLIAPRRIGLGMVTQLVSRSAAMQLLRATETFDRPVDTMLQMPWVTGISPLSVSPASVSEISHSLGGSTLPKRSDLLAKVKREILRPIYRLQILARSSRALAGKSHAPARQALPIAVAEPPTSS